MENFIFVQYKCPSAFELSTVQVPLELLSIQVQ